jgi:hypothetical protein
VLGGRVPPRTPAGKRGTVVLSPGAFMPITYRGGSGPRRDLPAGRYLYCANGRELRLYPDDGHVSVLNSAEAAMDWLGDHASQA